MHVAQLMLCRIGLRRLFDVNCSTSFFLALMHFISAIFHFFGESTTLWTMDAVLIISAVFRSSSGSVCFSSHPNARCCQSSGSR